MSQVTSLGLEQFGWSACVWLDTSYPQIPRPTEGGKGGGGGAAIMYRYSMKIFLNFWLALIHCNPLQLIHTNQEPIRLLY